MVVGISYALWQKVFVQENENVIISDCFEVSFESEEESAIYLNKAYPMKESEGIKLKPYVFRLKNVCSSASQYQINLEVLANSNMPDKVLRTKINEEGSMLLTNEVEPITGERAYKIGEGTLYPKEEKEFEFRVWMDEETKIEDNAMEKTFRGKISVVTSYQRVYQESILNGADPVLKEGLIPVVIENDGTVKKADILEEWYHYSNQKWANAIVLEDESISYQNGEIIPESNIESYFVWIPKYRYKLWDLGNYEGLTSINSNKVHDIEIIFGDYDTVDEKSGECKTPGVSGESGNCRVGDYMTHPAFQAFGTKGLWVGKFETGYKGATSTKEAEQNLEDIDKVEIKPNVYSWRGIQVANMHLNSYNYKREYDSHMMKNTEWGAVTYLQHSSYGSKERIQINNNSARVTGYAALNFPSGGYDSYVDYESINSGEDGNKTVHYFNNKSSIASTTGNRNGIFDMNGGTLEYVMGVMLHTNGTPCVGGDATYTSGFAGPYCNTTGNASGHAFPEKKYYDTYAYGTDDEHYNRRILGDATGEMGPFANATYGNQTRQISSWYQNESWFVSTDWPWVLRGHAFHGGFSAGVFTFSINYGSVYVNVGFRVVLAL